MRSFVHLTNRIQCGARARGGARRRAASCFLPLAMIAFWAGGRPGHAAPLGDAPPASDSSPDQTRTIDLRQAIELALRHNPEIKAAQDDVLVAVAQRERAAAEYWPSLRAAAGWTEHRRDQRLFPATRPGEPALVSHHILGGDLVLSVPIYSGGRISGNVELARSAERAARQTGQRTRDELTYRVTVTYYTILAQRLFLSALETSETALRRHVKTLAALVEERKAAPIDRQRVEVRLAALRQRHLQEENALRVQTLSLLSLIGAGGNRAAVQVVGELGPPRVPQPASSSELLVREALAKRSDYRAARALITGQEQRIKVARAGHLPKLLVQGSYGVRWGLLPSEQPEGVSAVADVGQVGLFVDIPLFEGGRVGAEAREQRARLSAMRERLRQTELRIRLEVETAALDLRAAMERVALSETTVAQAAEAFRVETEKQAAGKSTVSDVLAAQADLIDAEASRARALADANVAVAALKLAIGEER